MFIVGIIAEEEGSGRSRRKEEEGSRRLSQRKKALADLPAGRQVAQICAEEEKKKKFLAKTLRR